MTLMQTKDAIEQCMYSIFQGGFATNDEMCVSFLYYYPRHKYIYALTLPPLYQIIKAVEGIETQYVEFFTTAVMHIFNLLAAA